MIQVVPVETGLDYSTSATKSQGSAMALGQSMGQVEKITGAGRYIVLLGDGNRITVQGPESLRLGDKVQIVPSASKMVPSRPNSAEVVNFKESGLQWLAVIPLGFGGRKANARLEVYVEKKRESVGKVLCAVYLIFTVQTEKQGSLQWSIYLKGHQVALQVYASMAEKIKQELKNLIREVELGLKKKGFITVVPTNILDRPFVVPAGFRLSVKG